LHGTYVNVDIKSSNMIRAGLTVAGVIEGHNELLSALVGGRMEMLMKVNVA
jgi:hypothetical protein